MKFLSRLIPCALALLLLSCSVKPAEIPVTPSLYTKTPTLAHAVFLPTITPVPSPTAVASGIPLPQEGQLYHGVYPGGKTGEEDDLTFSDLLDYENEVGKNATWVYFSTNWYRSREFPTQAAHWIRNAGSIPYIRLMLRSELVFSGEEPVYTLQNILAGQFDEDLHAWCANARGFSTPLLVEYGTEVNSDSFPWSGVVNGGGDTSGYGDPALPDGPERFRDAYRHIIQICREEGAVNISWVFHVDTESTPEAVWNQIKYYYPGGEWIDWIGVSVYGVHTPMSPYYSIFREAMDRTYPRILEIAPKKPIIIAEFGTAKNSPFVDQVDWTRAALNDIISFRYKNVIGFSWWNEAWQNDDKPEHNTSMRIQDNPQLDMLFKEMVGNNPHVIGEISNCCN